MGYSGRVGRTTTAWGRWDCTRCGQRNITGRDKRCPSCGDPREQHELDAMRPPTDAELRGPGVTDAEELAETRAGADWSCGYCGSNNRGDAVACGSCGGARREATSMGKVGPVGKEVAAPFREPRPVRRSAAPPPPPPRSRTEEVAKQGFATWQIAVAVAAVLAVLLYWGCRDREEGGVVTRLLWTHTSQLQRWTDRTEGDWAPVRERREVKPIKGRGEVAGVDIRECHSKHHHDETYECGTESYEGSESYKCGTKQVCSDENNGNGSFTRTCTDVDEMCERSVTKTRTKHCERPVYKEWCDYVTQEWKDVRREDASGTGHEGLRFPEIPTRGDLERVERRAKYKIGFAWDKGHELHLEDVAREVYDAWQIGEAAVLQVEHFRGVVGFRKANASR